MRTASMSNSGSESYEHRDKDGEDEFADGGVGVTGDKFDPLRVGISSANGDAEQLHGIRNLKEPI